MRLARPWTKDQHVSRTISGETFGACGNFIHSLTTNLTTYYYNYGSQSKISDTRKETLSGYSMNKLRDYLIDYGFPLENEQAGIKRLKDSLSLKHIINDKKFIGILRNAKWNRNVQLSGFIEARKTVEQNLDIIDSYLTSTN